MNDYSDIAKILASRWETMRGMFETDGAGERTASAGDRQDVRELIAELILDTRRAPLALAVRGLLNGTASELGGYDRLPIKIIFPARAFLRSLTPR